jgi:hypothetical protein
MYKEYICNTVSPYRHFSVDEGCCFELLKGENVEEYEHLQLQQTQLAGASYRFSATLDL